MSGIFKVIADPDPAKAHSLGWGFTVSDGVEVTVSRLASGASAVYFNGRRIEFPTVIDATRRLTDAPLSVDIQTELPLSSGVRSQWCVGIRSMYGYQCTYGAAPCRSLSWLQSRMLQRLRT